MAMMFSYDGIKTLAASSPAATGSTYNYQSEMPTSSSSSSTLPDKITTIIIMMTIILPDKITTIIIMITIILPLKKQQ